ncbi:MAG: hypothetical protein HC852_01820 [Acaryochloridaceae cyanobacterium RU_4_10]|nr:hypothetical protein [Acaryochloridaceae cyanobacterium RU_4_10]
MNPLHFWPIPYRLQLVSCSPCDRSHQRQNFSPSLRLCDRSAQRFRAAANFSPSLSQCNTPSLRRESPKRAIAVATRAESIAFRATWPNDSALNCCVLSGASEDRNKPTHPIAGAPERCLLAKRLLILSQAAGAIS